MNRARVRFYGPLNDFLVRRKREQWIEHSFDGQPSVKDVIESLGVPHTEIETILVNRIAVDFGYLVKDQNTIEVYPPGWQFEARPAIAVRPATPDDRCFVLDTHLGRLAAYLRMLGFDTLYRNDYGDEELARVSSEENRILLTRDVGLLKRGIVQHGYFVRETNPEKQLTEIVRYYDLLPKIEPFGRCSKCNSALEVVSKDDIKEQLPPMTTDYFDEFRRCTGCGKIYWRGSHMDRLDKVISALRSE